MLRALTFCRKRQPQQAANKKLRVDSLEKRELLAADFVTWPDQEPSTPGIIDIYYDFRDQDDSFRIIDPVPAGTSFANSITSDQIAMAELAMQHWSDATKGKLNFIHDPDPLNEKLINIGTGDLAAMDSYQSGWLGTAGAGGQLLAGSEVTKGIAWMDHLELWDNVYGNGDLLPGESDFMSLLRVDYFTVAAHEIGHALGLSHLDDVPGDNIMNQYSGERTELSRNDIQQLHQIYDREAPDVLDWSISNPAGAAMTETSRGLVTRSQQIEVHLTDVEDDFATDDLLQIRFQVNGTSEGGYSAWESYSGEPLTIPLNYEGKNWINVQLRDLAGNTTWVYKSVIIDRSAPEASVNLQSTTADPIVTIVDQQGKTQQVTRSQSVQINLTNVTDHTERQGSANDDLTVRYAVNGKWSAWNSYAPTLNLPKLNYQGKNWIVVQVQDEANNIRTIYDSVTLDRSAPVATLDVASETAGAITQDASGVIHTTSRDIQIVMNVQDNVTANSNVEFSYRINSGTNNQLWQTATGEPVRLHLNYVGTNWINFWFKDEAGNVRWVYKQVVLDL